MPEGSWLTGAIRGGAVHLLALLIGLAAAVLVAFDHQVSLLEPVGDVGRKFPFIGTAALCGLIVAVGVVLMSGRWLFERRFAATVVFALIAAAVSGMNVGPVESTDVAMLFVVGFFFVTALIERHPIRIPLPLLIVVLLLFGCSVGSTINGGFGSLLAQRTFVNKCLMLLAMTSLVASAGLMPLVTRALPTIAVISAVIGIASVILYLGSGITLTAEDIAQYKHKETPLGMLPRATAFFPTTQAFGHFLLLGLSLLLLIPMRPRLRFFSAVVVCLAIVCTFSTGAYVAMTIVLLLFPFVRWPERSLHFLTGLTLVGCLVYVSGFGRWLYEALVVPLGGKGAEDRVGYIQAGLDTIIAHPVFGVGLRQIGRSLTTPVHNAYIQLTAELGIIAGVLFTGLVVTLIVAAAHAGFQRTSGATQLAMKGLFLGMVALSVHFCFEPFYDNFVSWAFMGIVAGSLAGLSSAQTAPRSYLIRPYGNGPRRGASLLGDRP